MPPINLSADVIQFLIYGGVAAGGYALRHLNVFRHAPATPDGPTAPAVPTTGHPILDKILAIVDDQVQKVLEDAAKRFVQPPKV